MPNSDELRYMKYTSSSSPHAVEGQLLGGDMLWLRRMVREEIEAAFARHEQRGLNHLMEAVTEPADETEEMAGVLAHLTPLELEMLIERVKEHRG